MVFAGFTYELRLVLFKACALTPQLPISGTKRHPPRLVAVICPAALLINRNS